MQRTVKIKLQKDNDLIRTIREYSKVMQYICNLGLKKKSYNKNKLHQWTYKKLRLLYPAMPSAILQTARDVASEALKRTKLKKKVKSKEYSAMRLDKRNLRVNMEYNLISISSIEDRKKINFNNTPMTLKYKDWSAIAGTLCFKNNNLYLNLVLEKENPSLNLENIMPTEFIGLDRGIKNIVAGSNNQFFTSSHLREVKGKYQYLRKVLQSKGTSSALRKLKRIAGKEKRFVSDTNHCLSKWIANSDSKVFVLENLKKISNCNYGNRFNKKLGNWSFRQFETYLHYNLEFLGKLLIKVNPKYTSQMCSKSGCNHIEKANRHGSVFKCKKCGYELHSDLNASRNIVKLGISMFNRLQVNQPIVTPMVVTNQLIC